MTDAILEFFSVLPDELENQMEAELTDKLP